MSVQNNQLVVEGERKPPEGFKQNAYTQLAYGKFYTAVTLPSGLDLDKLSPTAAPGRAGRRCSCRMWLPTPDMVREERGGAPDLRVHAAR